MKDLNREIVAEELYNAVINEYECTVKWRNLNEVTKEVYRTRADYLLKRFRMILWETEQ
jgi:hypothetical protein